MGTNRVSSPISRRSLAKLIVGLSRLCTDLFGALSASNSAKGTTFYVDSVTGVDDTKHGSSPLLPFATVAYAHSQCVTGRGDLISCAPGHAESFTTAAAATFSKNDVTIVGQGVGRGRPTFTWSTSTAAQIIISGSRVFWKNCVFDFTGFDAVAVAISVTGNDVVFTGNEFITNSAATGVVKGIETSGSAVRFQFIGNTTFGPAINAGTTTTAVISLESVGPYLIDNNTFCGKMTQAVLNTTATLLDGLIHNNRFLIYTGTKGIALKSTTTALMTNNRFNVPSGTAPIVAAAGFVAGNSYSAAAGVTAGAASTF